MSDISQIATLIRNDNNGTLVGVFKDGDEDNAMLTLSPYFSKLHYCGNLLDISCWPNPSHMYNGSIVGAAVMSLEMANGNVIRPAGPEWTFSSCTNNPNESVFWLNC